RRRMSVRAPLALGWTSATSSQAYLCFRDALFAFRAAHGGNRFSGSLVTILFSLLAGFFNLFVDVFHVQLAYLLDELFKLLGIDCTRLGKYQHILAKCH